MSIRLNDADPGAGARARQRTAQPGPAPVSEVSLPPAECRRRRLALGLSPYDLARLAGLQERTVTKLEAALVHPRPVTVVALRKALRRAESERRPQA